VFKWRRFFKPPPVSSRRYLDAYPPTLRVVTERLASIRVGIKDATLSRKRPVVRVRLVTIVCIKRQIAAAVVQNGNSSRKA
jgi:hypothetical protein